MLDDIPGVYEMNNPPAGGSFRDITRVAGSNPDLWDGIIKSNSREVSQYLESLEKLVKDWKEKLITENLPVKEIFQKSALIRSKIIKNTDSSKEGNHGNHNS
jgi:prephenate dehydrogenase